MKDRQLWKEIYEKHARRMFFICRRYASNDVEAEDMMHDGFIQIFKSLHTFTDRGEGSLRAWMDKVMVNTCLQHLRKKDVLRESASMEYAASDRMSLPDADALEQAVADIPHEVLLRFISELPVGYRTVFNLYVFEGLSHKEIARQLGIKERSSSSQYHRAKTILARQIRDYERKQR
ncbi:MAG: sigma-70 family RNA polymerase sigma factor [Bacteroidales bacterium]|jgi:RNA polymerase sigma-70 factor (ECF subfamily)